MNGRHTVADVPAPAGSARPTPEQLLYERYPGLRPQTGGDGRIRSLRGDGPGPAGTTLVAPPAPPSPRGTTPPPSAPPPSAPRRSHRAAPAPAVLPARRRRRIGKGPLVAAAAVLAVIAGLAVVPVVNASAAPGPWVESFDRAVPRGSVGSDGRFPGYEDVWAYGDGTRTTHGGTYRPSRVNSVQGGALTWTITGKEGSSVTIGPSAVGGEWSVRMRTDMIGGGMHIADMRWPDNNEWPGTNGSGGEIDFPEGNLDEQKPYAAVVDDEGKQKPGGGQMFNPYPHPRTPKPWTEWHTYTTQVDPGKFVRMYQDGVLVGEVTSNVPRTAIHEQFQVEPSWGGGNIKGGVVQVSAVAYSPKLDKSTITAAGGETSSAGTTAGGGSTSSGSTGTAASTPASSGSESERSTRSTTRQRSAEGSSGGTTASPTTEDTATERTTATPEAAAQDAAATTTRTPAGRDVRPSVAARGAELVLQDEFRGSALDTSTWTPAVAAAEKGGAGGCTVPDVVSVSRGALHLAAGSDSGDEACSGAAGKVTLDGLDLSGRTLTELKVRLPGGVGLTPVWDARTDRVSLQVAATGGRGGDGRFHTYALLTSRDAVTLYVDGVRTSRVVADLDPDAELVVGFERGAIRAASKSNGETADVAFVRVWDIG